MMCIAEDDETQKTGIVCVFYNVGPVKMNEFHPAMFAKGASMLKAIPVRIVGCHYCFSDPKIRNIMSIIMMAAGSQNRARFRLHHGT